MFSFIHDSICDMCFLHQQTIFAHAQTLSRMSSLSGRLNIARVNIRFFTGFKKIKQRCISFVLGYLRLTLWKISTAISIKHRILATFNIIFFLILTAFNLYTWNSNNIRFYLIKNNFWLFYLCFARTILKDTWSTQTFYAINDCFNFL